MGAKIIAGKARRGSSSENDKALSPRDFRRTKSDGHQRTASPLGERGVARASLVSVGGSYAVLVHGSKTSKRNFARQNAKVKTKSAGEEDVEKAK